MPLVVAGGGACGSSFAAVWVVFIARSMRVLIPNELTTKTLEKSHKGEEVETFETLKQMFESWK